MAQATYNGEDFSVTFEAHISNPYLDDPSWPHGEVEDVSIEGFKFLGLDMPIEHIPDNVYDALLEYADECEEWD